MASIDRRRVLLTAAALPLGLAVGTGWPRGRAWASAPRTLVLLELNGGNDGLNSVVPYNDPAYARARPKLAVKRDDVLPLDENLGLHRRLEPLMEPWQEGELGIALGVGYPRPNRSHFRSIEIWNTASTSEDTLQAGWLQAAQAEAGERSALGSQLGVVLGGPPGPLAGDSFTAVVMKDRRQLRTATRLLEGDQPESTNPALEHILAVRLQAQGAAQLIEARLQEAPAIKASFPKTALGRQLQLAATMIAGDVPAAVIKVQQGGYDTHAGQAGSHPRLLSELGEAVAAFRTALKETGAWERCLLMTYAEFGRRVAENASGGTDHGTAAPHFLMGGRLRGGFYGKQPSLTDLEAGDLRHNLDFRQLYASAAVDWLGLPPGLAALGGRKPLPFLV